MMKRAASAAWTGGLKDGKGSLTSGSKTLNSTPYSFNSRFENGSGTNPEELIAAAHAGCFTMAFAFALEQAGMNGVSVQTQATVTLDQVSGGFAITGIVLATTARVPGADAAKVKQIGEEAKKNCPISKALASVPITLEAKIEV